MKGGHASSGPPPDPSSIRSAKAGWETLPGAGRQAEPPEWPLKPAASVREKQVWARLWRSPQAVMWEQLGLDDEVAHYVRVYTEAEQREASTTTRNLRKQLGEALGLTLPGMRMLRWRIEYPPAVKVSRTAAAEQDSPRPSMRDRLGMVAGGG